MPLTGYDSADPSKIPADAPVIFPYLDGRYAWQQSRFPKAKFRYITVLGDARAAILDWEPGCVYNPDTLLKWVETRHGRGEGCTVYCNRSDFPRVREILDGKSYGVFLSTLDGTRLSSYEGVALRACQYATEHGYDISDVWAEEWPLNP